ncbi:MAG: hypothetical protein AB7O59_22390 [Pirellulales bacterium]
MNIITQDSLRQLLALREAKKQEVALRQSILALLDDGGRVEPGKLILDIKTVNASRVITQALVTDVLGPTALAKLYARMPERTIRQLWIKAA